MIVDRREFYIKDGHLEEAVQMALADNKGKTNVRFYTPRTGRANTLAIEWEFESLAAYENYWNAWFATPEATAFLAKWRPLTEPGSTAELWELVK